MKVKGKQTKSLSPNEVERIRFLASQGYSEPAIAKKLDRPITTIRYTLEMEYQRQRLKQRNKQLEIESRFKQVRQKLSPPSHHRPWLKSTYPLAQLGKFIVIIIGGIYLGAILGVIAVTIAMGTPNSIVAPLPKMGTAALWGAIIGGALGGVFIWIQRQWRSLT